MSVELTVICNLRRPTEAQLAGFTDREVDVAYAYHVLGWRGVIADRRGSWGQDADGKCGHPPQSCAEIGRRECVRQILQSPEGRRPDEPGWQQRQN